MSWSRKEANEVDTPFFLGFDPSPTRRVRPPRYQGIGKGHHLPEHAAPRLRLRHLAAPARQRLVQDLCKLVDKSLSSKGEPGHCVHVCISSSPSFPSIATLDFIDSNMENLD